METSLRAADIHRISQELVAWLPRLQGRRLMVVGDVGIDEYVLGEVRRISPEAPVPVLEVSDQQQRIGLAANVAQNISSLGGEAYLVGIIGNDGGAQDLKTLLKQAQVSPDYLLVDESRPTTRKMRVMAEHHHLVRVDFEQRRFLTAEMESRLLSKVEEHLPNMDGLIIEDYAKGVLSESLSQNLIQLGKRYQKPVMIDPNPRTPPAYYRGCDLITPNREESIALSAFHFDDLRSPQNIILEVGAKILSDLRCGNVVITRGKEGMSLFTSDSITHMPTFARQVFDVTGAGDTVIAAIALAWVSGLSLEKACVLANFAAGVVVGKVGCVPCTLTELTDYIHEHCQNI